MSARDEILRAVRARRTRSVARPKAYARPGMQDEPMRRFIERAEAESAEIRFVKRLEDVPQEVADILRARNMAACIHCPPDVRIEGLNWPAELATKRDAPGPNDAAVAIAPYAIAETGTLVYPSAANAPASWHFRPGLEIAILSAADILPRLEDVLARLRKAGAMPSTVNLVTGPSRTGDIEQTMELGAHGPKALSILIVEG